MNTGDRCPRKHLSCGLGPPTSSGPVHRYRGPRSPQPPRGTWRGAGGAPGLPASLPGIQGGTRMGGFYVGSPSLRRPGSNEMVLWWGLGNWG